MHLICVLVLWQFFKDRHYLDKEWGKYFEVNIKKQQPPNIAIMYIHETNVSLISDEHREEMEKRRWF
jgi:hypothetical protein